MVPVMFFDAREVRQLEAGSDARGRQVGGDVALVGIHRTHDCVHAGVARVEGRAELLQGLLRARQRATLGRGTPHRQRLKTVAARSVGIVFDLLHIRQALWAAAQRDVSQQARHEAVRGASRVPDGSEVAHPHEAHLGPHAQHSAQLLC
eukprot:665264-Prymnesium_polylepis.1